MILRRILLYDLLSILEHLYDNGADYVDIVGMSHVDGTQDEIMIAVKDEYISSYRPEDDNNVEEVDKMEGVANIVEAPPAEKIKKLTEEVLLNLL